MKKIAGLGVAAVLALSGCATFEGMTTTARPPSNCGPGACQFDVIVAACNNIKVSRDPIVVEPGHQGPIQWKLEPGSRWEFAVGGIVIHQGSDGEFNPAGNSPQVVTWNNKHGNAGKIYKYDVIVQPRGGGQVCHLDPSIMN